jgi:hypothetical protein
VQLGHPSRIFLRPRLSRCVGATLERKLVNWGGRLGLTCSVPGVTRALVVGRGLVALVELVGARVGGPRAVLCRRGRGLGQVGMGSPRVGAQARRCISEERGEIARLGDAEPADIGHVQVEGRAGRGVACVAVAALA